VTERLFVRILIGAALCAALLVFALVSVPMNAEGDPDLPAAAFAQVGLYRLEAALLVFYGSLLLATPAFSGLARGRLPIEISMRGAKFAEETDQSTEAAKAAIKELESTTESLSEDLAAASIEIEELKGIVRRDNRQPEVNSKS
jgi:hypothetical protein